MTTLYMFYSNNLLRKSYFSPGVPHHGECPKNPVALATRPLSYKQPTSKSCGLLENIFQMQPILTLPTSLV